MWNPKIINTDISLYIAIAEAIERDIRLGILKPGDKMPPQRALAKQIGVNLTTITRAYKNAEQRGLIVGNTGSGTIVANYDYTRNEGKSNHLPEPVHYRGTLDMGLVGSLSEYDLPLGPIINQIASDSQLKEWLDYTPSQGLLSHREVAAQWVSAYGVKVDASQMVICAGAMHAVNCTLLSLFEPGDRIVTDTLTFTGIKSIAKMTRMKLKPVEMDDEGMIPEALEAVCRKGNIKGIYLMPNLQNPTATSMSPSRKQAIADIIRTYNLILIEDDIYNYMNMREKVALSALVPEQSIFICGVSKGFYPGLRISFVAVPKTYLQAFSLAVANTLWMAPTMNAEIICKVIQEGMAQKIINKKREVIKERLNIAMDYLRGFQYNASENSPYLWLQLPADWTPADFEDAARAQGVSVISSHKFYVGNQNPPNAIRVSLGSVDDEGLIKGLEIIVKLLKRQSDLIPPVFL